jgi:hypothetical protein
MKSRFLLVAVAASLLSLAVCSSAFAVTIQYRCAVGDTAQARDDVDVYDSPVKPRHKYKHYFIKQGRQAEVLARHKDGWCKLKGVAPDSGDGWVAEDHLRRAEGGNGGMGNDGQGAGGGAEMPATPATLSECKVVGPQEEAGGGSNIPTKQFVCTSRDANNSQTCCWVTGPTSPATLKDCKVLGPNEGAGGGSNDPKKQFVCTERDANNNKTCCWVTIQ